MTSIQARLISIQGLSFETSFPQVAIVLSVGRTATESKLMKKASMISFPVNDYKFQIGKDGDYLMIEVNEVQGTSREVIAAGKIAVPDDYLTRHPNKPDKREIELDGGGTLILSLTYLSSSAPPLSVVNSHASASRPFITQTNAELYTGTNQAMAVTSASCQFLEVEYEYETVSSTEVVVKVGSCGINATDLKVAQNAWGNTSYPFVPGHEIIGMIETLGNEVVGFSEQGRKSTSKQYRSTYVTGPGQRVGLGWLCDACWKCEHCVLQKKPYLCDARKPTVFQCGGLSERVKCDYRFLIPISMDGTQKIVTPLLGSGIAAYAPLVEHGKQDMEIAVVGLGQVGEYAVKFATNMGMQVTCYSHTALKEEQAVDEWLAFHFVHVRASSNMIPKVYRNSYDLIMFTSSADYNWDSLLNALTPNGTLCIIGFPPGEISFSEEFKVNMQTERRQPFHVSAPQTAPPTPDAKPVNVVWSNGANVDTFEQMIEFAISKNIAVKTNDHAMRSLTEKPLQTSESGHDIYHWSTSHL